MKRILSPIILVAIATLLWAAISFAQGDGSTAVVAVDAGTEITYQGQLVEGGLPADGTYDFVFRLWDARTNGAQVGNDVAVDDVAVAQGRFAVLIDFGAAVYSGQELYMEIDVKQDRVATYETLAPRQLLTGVPLAHTVRPGMQVQSTSGTSATFANGTYGGTFTGPVTGLYAHGGLYDLELSGAGVFGLGGIIRSDSTIGNSYLGLFSNDGVIFSLDSNNDGDDSEFTIVDDGDTVMTVNGPLLSMIGPAGGRQVRLNAFGDYGALSLYQPSNFFGINALGYQTSGGGGLLQIFNNSGLTTVELDGDQSGGGPGGVITLYDGTGTSVGVWQNEAGEGGGQFDLRDSDGNVMMVLEAEQTTDTGAGLIMRNANGNDVIFFDADKNFGGGGAEMVLFDNQGDVASRLHNDVTEGGGELQLFDLFGQERVRIEANETFGDGAQLMLFDSTGAATIVLDADYEGTGDGRVTTEVLEITGGSDLSEQFDVSAAAGDIAAEPQPGMVVCIDAEHPGRLVVCSQAYDPTVAGIISGAGGVQPGLLMRQEGSEADGRYPVALTGRVYVWAVAGDEPIAPGDLLTTAGTPDGLHAGYAMRASDPQRAFGSILGKAMSGLEAGQDGLILVLVSLQ